MKHCKHPAWTLSLLLAVAAGGAALALDAKEARRLQMPAIEVLSPRCVFEAQREIRFDVSVLNRSNAPLALSESGLFDPQTGRPAPAVTLALTDRTGQQVIKSESGPKAAPSAGDKPLAPGAKRTDAFAFSRWAGKLKPGVYGFSVTLRQGAQTADSNVLIFEIATPERIRAIKTMEKRVHALLHARTPEEAARFISSEGVWVDEENTMRMLYTGKRMSQFMVRQKIPRFRVIPRYLPAYQGVGVGETNGPDEVFSLRSEGGELKVRSIRTVQ